MIATAFDLDGYCGRIGYAGARTPTLDTLRAVHALHPQAIAFENLDVLLGRGVRLDADSLQAKLVRAGRGGYCFEQNSLFHHALSALGFAVTAMTARIRYQVPDEVRTAKTHMLLRVDIDGVAWIADVGFGGNTMTGPLRLDDPAEQATPHGAFRLVATGNGYCAEAKLRGAWAPLYIFTLDPQHQPDLELGNWFTSTHPQSRFKRGLIAGRVMPDGRFALNGRELAFHRLNAPSERRVLETESELRDALTGLFGLTLPDDPGLGAALAKTSGGAV
ncbi:MAG: arylamine N-acetyltransferase [Pseudolabrys sp.]|nr:arylamine N-acetyltransferase [Pseudolabrys sp.]MDP2299074.1 arylamine N-acetyltransferase [Pseudolabrys sp.]